MYDSAADALGMPTRCVKSDYMFERIEKRELNEKRIFHHRSVSPMCHKCWQHCGKIIRQWGQLWSENRKVEKLHECIKFCSFMSHLCWQCSWQWRWQRNHPRHLLGTNGKKWEFSHFRKKKVEHSLWWLHSRVEQLWKFLFIPWHSSYSYLVRPWLGSFKCNQMTEE